MNKIKNLEMLDEKHHKLTYQNHQIRLDNMYEIYNIRPELLRSRQFYSNAFDTSVNYEDLMALKKELMR